MTGNSVQRPADKASAPMAERLPPHAVTGRPREFGMDPAAPDRLGKLADAEPEPAERLLARVNDELADAEPEPAERLLAWVNDELNRPRGPVAALSNWLRDTVAALTLLGQKCRIPMEI